ncbi:uncharacterized protein LOC119101559 [Pollicipes pollicipes]|uniref:uncharacterized protein LOC119101559 n=1 Tax=Pollicipes pollicipes TaxID=41117 RepID=UPI001884A2CB|nr:uncharacterized protein LOC119101559 [Pollicipes pollicipes]
MKLIVCIVLAVSAMVAADEGFFPQSAQSAPDTYSNYNYNNYYDYQPPKQTGWLDRLFGATRRQGLGGLLGGLGGIGAVGPIIGVVVAVVAVIAVVAGIGYVVTTINSSGRGLDTDDWEVNHSVWMDQLQRDFEDSWSTQ